MQKVDNQTSCTVHQYNAGNYYNYAAATAGSDNHTITIVTEVPNSICPKGWQLPPNDGNKSYQRLIRDAYQIADGPSGSMDKYLLENTAMSFVRLGQYYPNNGSLITRDYTGYYWSSSVSDSIVGRYLYFSPDLFNPRYGASRNYGFSIRCVSR